MLIISIHSYNVLTECFVTFCLAVKSAFLGTFTLYYPCMFLFFVLYLFVLCDLDVIGLLIKKKLLYIYKKNPQ